MGTKRSRARGGPETCSDIGQEESDKQRSASQHPRRGHERQWNESELSAPEELKSFPADAASGNYLTMEKPGLQFSAKDISRARSKPTEKDQRRLVRRILRAQGSSMISSSRGWTLVTVHTDSDWAGCRSSRKSTSGGVASTDIGVVQHGTSTHRLVALSWCEAELDAMNKGSSRDHGNQELGRRCKCSTGSCQQAWRRKDAPHFDTQERWLQNAMRN